MVIGCTKKLLDFLGVKPQKIAVETDPLFSWTVNLIILNRRKTLVAVSEDFYRPTDVVNLWGDPTKAKAKLGWDPNKTSFEQLVKIMVDADMAKVAVERASEHITTNLVEYLEKGIVK